MESTFNEKQLALLKLDVSEYTEDKGKFTYLSWASAWQEFLKIFPDATYTVKKADSGQCWFGSPEFGYMVYTTVTVEGLTREMWLPVMNNNNKSIKEPTTTEINKAVMRCLTKNLAMMGCGLYIYRGEDLPEPPEPTNLETVTKATKTIYFDLRDKLGQENLDAAIKMNINAVTKIMKSGDESKITELHDVLTDVEA